MSNKKTSSLFVYDSKGDLIHKEVINCHGLIYRLFPCSHEIPLKEIVLEAKTENGEMARIIIPNKSEGPIKVMLPFKFDL